MLNKFKSYLSPKFLLKILVPRTYFLTVSVEAFHPVKTYQEFHQPLLVLSFKFYHHEPESLSQNLAGVSAGPTN